MLYVELVTVDGPASEEDSYNSLEWWYDLDQPFVMHSEALRGERRYETRLVAERVTYEASVLLPRLPVDDYVTGGYLIPPLGWSATTPEETKEDWGVDYKTQAMGVVGAVVKRLAFVGPLPPDDAVTEYLRDEFGLDMMGIDVRNEVDKWWDNVRAWLEISTGQRLTQVGAQRRTWDSHSRTRIWLASSGTNREHWRGGGIEISSPPVAHGVDADIFAACTALSDAEPPPAWALLRDARALQGVGQHRRAVIDAATAAELAVGELLDDLLKEVKKEIRDAFLGTKPMLGSKAALLEKLGQGLPDSFTERLVNQRNKAVHKGVDLTFDECESAIQEALDLVERVYPLPTPPGGLSPLVCRWQV